MEVAPLNLNNTVDGMLKMLGRLIGEDIAVQTNLARDLGTILGDAGQLEQVIVNLAVNARDAMPAGGKLTIKTENTLHHPENLHRTAGARPDRFVCLSVTDTGVGMDHEILQHIFEPFFTTKAAGKGTGLGLSVVYGIVAQHKGWVNVYSEPGQGSTFKVYLPITTASADISVKEPPNLADLQGHGERVLVVEDQDEVLQLAVRLLSENGYVVYEASNATTALELFEQEKGDFALVFSDVVLPDFDGIRLLDDLRRRKPDCRVLLVSGYADERSRWPLIRERGYRFINKPYAIADLLKLIREVIDGTGPDPEEGGPVDPT
jgi:two-component system, cell cycle sensor histidine kinase and response regulator CckA